MLKAARFAPGVRARWLSGSLAAAIVLLVTSGNWLGCPMQRVFHRPCPTCGTSRALWLLAHGHVDESIALQPLAAPAVLWCWLMLSVALNGLRSGTPPRELLRARANRAGLLLGGALFSAIFALWWARSSG